jgi:hypothetical protein
MRNQHTTPQTTAASQTTRARVRAIFVVAALLILLLSLDQSAAELSNFLGSVAKDAIVLLPSLAITTSQALYPEASAHHGFPLCSLQMLLFWPALQTIANVTMA